MSTLLIHFISDFLRDTAPTDFGESLRCKVLENEATAMTTYGLNQQQQGEILKRNRAAILARMSAEVGAVMDELDGVLDAFGTAYPAGAVHLKKADVVYTDTTGLRLIRIRGAGMERYPSVSFTPTGGGSPTPGTFISHTCDRDVWQRLQVTARLGSGTYHVTVTNPVNGASSSIDFTVP